MTQIVTPLPSRSALKTQARRLRDSLSDQGTIITHARALEMVARQWGYRDWNTLSAAAPADTPLWQIGQKVAGRYLGHPFSGRISAIQMKGTDHAHLVLDFDQPVDVVASPRFSALRRRVRCTVNALGRTVEKTSDGQPHVQLNTA